MGVKYILKQASRKLGLNPADPNQRETLLLILNEAADELYNQSDMVGSMFEQNFKVNGDETISLPSCVGELRAVRETNSYIPWHVQQMRPRYNIANWKDMWRGWRIKNHQALQRAITNESILTIETVAVESPAIVVTLTGPTLSAASVTEDVTLNSISVDSLNSYTDITVSRKDRVNGYDINVKDVDGVIVTVIPNNMVEARYLVVDISMLPWSNTSSSQQDHYVEILYKKALQWLSNDGDEFPAPGYDNILVNKMMQLVAEEQEKGDKAIAFDNKATRSLARKQENENRATEDRVAFVTNGHDELLTRLRTNRPGRHHASIYPYGIS